MYTVDTSVWVNGSDTMEAGHEISRACLQLLAQRGDHLVLPTLVLPEIAGAISRTRSAATLGETFAAQVAALPTGFMLIRMSCLDKMTFPYFPCEFGLGEDVAFCVNAQKAGIEVWCDPTLEIKHIGDYAY